MTRVGSGRERRSKQRKASSWSEKEGGCAWKKEEKFELVRVDSDCIPVAGRKRKGKVIVGRGRDERRLSSKKKERGLVELVCRSRDFA